MRHPEGPPHGHRGVHLVSVRDALDGAFTAIAAAGSPSARLDAELLLADALATTRERIYADPSAPVGGAAVRAFQSHVRRRAGTRAPVAYIVGRKAFRQLELGVDPRVLVPRPETELLVELALALPHGAAVLDCATGSGAIALALKDERPDLRMTGSDVDPDALAVAAGNAQRLRLEVEWLEADLLDGLPDAYDAIVANPPYVPTAAIDGLEPEIARHEPRRALDGGASGLEVLERLIDAAAHTHAAHLFVEHGHDQAAAVERRCAVAGFVHTTRHRDLAGWDRAVEARR